MMVRRRGEMARGENDDDDMEEEVSLEHIEFV